MKYLLFLSIGIFLTSCTGTQMKNLYDSPALTEVGVHALKKPFIPKIQENGLFHLSCTDKYPNGVSVYEAFDQDGDEFGRAQLAKKHFFHAAMANNAYRDPLKKPTFIIPDWYLLTSLESKEGLGLEAYGNGSTLEDSTKLVIAFRGTEFESKNDWKNNLSMKEPPQYKQAFSYISDLKKTYPEKDITVVGHSLGGGIAINMALRIQNISAVAFNPSPRLFFGKTNDYENNITVMYEVGEVLDSMFGLWNRVRLPASTHYGNYNFLDYKVWTFSPVPEHGIYEFARALTVVAMTREDEFARKLFISNIPRGEAERVDWDNCKYLYQ